MNQPTQATVPLSEQSHHEQQQQQPKKSTMKICSKDDCSIVSMQSTATASTVYTKGESLQQQHFPSARDRMKARTKEAGRLVSSSSSGINEFVVLHLVQSILRHDQKHVPKLTEQAIHDAIRSLKQRQPNTAAATTTTSKVSPEAVLKRSASSCSSTVSSESSSYSSQILLKQSQKMIKSQAIQIQELQQKLRKRTSPEDQMLEDDNESSSLVAIPRHLLDFTGGSCKCSSSMATDDVPSNEEQQFKYIQQLRQTQETMAEEYTELSYVTRHLEDIHHGLRQQLEEQHSAHEAQSMQYKSKIDQLKQRRNMYQQNMKMYAKSMEQMQHQQREREQEHQRQISSGTDAALSQQKKQRSSSMPQRTHLTTSEAARLDSMVEKETMRRCNFKVELQKQEEKYSVMIHDLQDTIAALQQEQLQESEIFTAGVPEKYDDLTTSSLTMAEWSGAPARQITIRDNSTKSLRQEKYDRIIAQCEATIKQLKLENSTFREQRDALVRNSSSRQDGVFASKCSDCDKIVEQREHIQTLSQELETLRPASEQMKRLQRSLVERESQLKTIRRERDNVKEHLRKQQLAFVETKQPADVHNALNSTKEQKKQLALVTKLQTKVARKSKQIATLNKQLETTKETITKVSKTYAMAVYQLQQHEKNVRIDEDGVTPDDRHRVALAKLQAQLDASGVDLIGVRSQLEQSTKDAEQNSEALDETRRILQDAKSDFAAVQTELHTEKCTFQTELRAKEDKIELIQTELEEQQEHITKHINEQMLLEDATKVERSKLEASNARIKQLQSTLVGVQGNDQQDKLREKVAANDASILQLKTALNDAHAREEYATEGHKRMQAKLRDDLEANDARITQLQTLLTDAHDRLDHATKDHVKIQTKFQEKVAKNDASILQLQMALTNANAREEFAMIGHRKIQNELQFDSAAHEHTRNQTKLRSDLQANGASTNANAQCENVSHEQEDIQTKILGECESSDACVLQLQTALDDAHDRLDNAAQEHQDIQTKLRVELQANGTSILQLQTALTDAHTRLGASTNEHEDTQTKPRGEFETSDLSSALVDANNEHAKIQLELRDELEAKNASVLQQQTALDDAHAQLDKAIKDHVEIQTKLRMELQANGSSIFELQTALMDTNFRFENATNAHKEIETKLRSELEANDANSTLANAHARPDHASKEHEEILLKLRDELEAKNAKQTIDSETRLEHATNAHAEMQTKLRNELDTVNIELKRNKKTVEMLQSDNEGMAAKIQASTVHDRDCQVEPENKLREKLVHAEQRALDLKASMEGTNHAMSEELVIVEDALRETLERLHVTEQEINDVLTMSATNDLDELQQLLLVLKRKFGNAESMADVMEHVEMIETACEVESIMDVTELLTALHLEIVNVTTKLEQATDESTQLKDSLFQSNEDLNMSIAEMDEAVTLHEDDLGVLLAKLKETEDCRDALQAELDDMSCRVERAVRAMEMLNNNEQEAMLQKDAEIAALQEEIAVLQRQLEQNGATIRELESDQKQSNVKLTELTKLQQQTSGADGTTSRVDELLMLLSVNRMQMAETVAENDMLTHQYKQSKTEVTLLQEELKEIR